MVVTVTSVVCYVSCGLFSEFAINVIVFNDQPSLLPRVSYHLTFEDLVREKAKLNSPSVVR